MMRVALVTLHTPTVNNYRGASALPYHLIAFRPKDIEIEIWSYNLNGCDAKKIAEVESQLGVKIHLIRKPRFFSYLQLTPVRLLLGKPVLGYLRFDPRTAIEINRYLNTSDSAVWIYGEDISGLATQFGNRPVVITTPDCEAMYYYRTLEMKGIPSDRFLFARYALMYHRYSKFASKYPSGHNIRYHLVGEADAAFLKRLNSNVEVAFIRHPHYDVTRKGDDFVSENNDRIRMLIAGRYDFTMSRAADEVMKAMVSLHNSVKDRYYVTFLGKGWESCRDTLINAGYRAEIKSFVEDYASEVSSHQIQLTPVAVGTGTKGKVLDAFANGLLVIGTPLALENIAVKNGVDCVRYSSAEELVSWLNKLAQSPSLIKEMAYSGRNAILREHSREKISLEFFDLFKLNPK